MADANAGTLSVAITGDISDLLAALQQAQDAATAAGTAIASALATAADNSNLNIGTELAAQFQTAEDAAQTAGSDIADALTPISTDAANAAASVGDICTALGDVAPEAVDAEASISNLSDALGEASTTATDTSNAVSDIGSSADDLSSVSTDAEDLSTALDRAGSSAEDAGSGLASAGTEAQSAGQSAEAAEGMFAGLGEQLVTIAETVGIGLGLEELGKEAITAASQVQQLTTSFTFLSGSTEQAVAQVEQLKEMALQLNQPFSSVASAAQSMTAKLGDFNLAAQLIPAAANYAQVAGQSFDTVASKLERMALSGTASTRTLASVGLNTGLLADAMNTLGNTTDVTSANVTKVFKALDSIPDQVAVVTQAMAKFDGASQTFSSDMQQQWTDFKTQFEFDLEAAGNALVPFISAVESSMRDLLQAVAPASEAIANIVAPAVSDNLRGLADGVRAVSSSFKDLMGSVTPISGLIDTISKSFQDLIGMNITDYLHGAVTQFIGFATGAQQARDAMTVIAAAMELASGKAATFQAALLDVTYNENQMLPPTKAAADATTQAGNAAGDAAPKHINLGSALATVGTAAGTATTGNVEFVQSVKQSSDGSVQLNDALLQIASNFGKLTPIQVAWNAAQEKNAQQIHGAMTDYDQWNQDLQQIATGGLPQVITDYDKWNESLITVSGALTTFGTKWGAFDGQLGLLKNGIVVLTGAASDSKVKFDAFGLAIGTAGQTVVETNGKITNLAGAVALANADWEASASKIYDAKAALDSFNSSSDAAQEAMTGVSTAGMSDVDAFNAISNAAQAAMGSVDDLTDSMDAAIDAENSLDDSGGMGGGGGGGGKGGGGNTDVMTLQSMLQAGALGSQVSMAAQMMGLVQVGNQAFETIAAYNDELKATGSSLQLVQDAAGQFVLEEQNATTATKTNTTATTANTSATTSNTTATTTASTATGALATAAAGGVPNMIALSDATTATATAAAALTSATTTTTTAVSSLGDAATTAAGDTGQSYQQLAANLKQFGSVVTDGTVDLGQLTSALAQLNSNVTEMSVSVQKTTSDNAALDTQTENAISALQAAYTAAGKLSTTLDIVNTGLFGFVGILNNLNGPFSSTPPNYTYTPGSYGNTGGPGMFQGNQPGSAPWSPSAPTTFQQAMPSMLQINVNSPSAQTTAQSIVSALRNNAGLKV